MARHPIFETNIPGLMCPPLEIQAKNFKPVNNINSRLLEEFQVSLLVKEVNPSTIRIGYDRKLHEKVALLHYEAVSDDDASDLVKETSMLRSLIDKNILMYYGMVLKPSDNSMYLSFESFDYFLSQLLSEDQQLFEPPVIKCVMIQLLMGLKFLHYKDIVHRDINPKNLVITEKGDLKISNFRSAQTLYEKPKAILTEDFSYQPVDVLLESETVSTADDMWSAMCIFAEMLLKKKLFQSTHRKEVLYDICSLLGIPDEDIYPEFVKLPDYKFFGVRGFYKFNCLNKHFKDTQSLDLLKNGFLYDPKYRICSEGFLDHPYIKAEPNAMSVKCFGGLLHGKIYKFPVK